MPRLTFGQQLTLGLGMLAGSMGLGHFFQAGVIENIAWILYGGLWLWNPVWPETWNSHNPAKRKREARWVGALFVLVGLCIRFTV